MKSSHPFVLSALFVLMSALLLLIGGCTSKKGYKLYYPEGFRGWTCIFFNVEGTPLLEEDDGYHVIKYPSEGYLETSSQLRTSPSRNHYFYYNGDQVRDATEMKHGGGGTSRQLGQPKLLLYGWETTREHSDDYERFGKGKPAPPEDITRCGWFEGVVPPDTAP